MTFEEFMSSRLAELLRFALVLCGSRELSSELTVAALRNNRRNWDDVLASGDPLAAVRTSIVRGYLAGSVRAARVSVLDDEELAAEVRHLEWAGLASRLRSLSKRQRAVTCLRHYSGLDEAEVAAAVGSADLTGTRGDLARARTALGIRDGDTAADAPPGQTVEALEALLELISDQLRVDVAAVIHTLDLPEEPAADRPAAPGTPTRAVSPRTAPAAQRSPLRAAASPPDPAAEPAPRREAAGATSAEPARPPVDDAVAKRPSRFARKARRRRPDPSDLALDMLLALTEQSTADAATAQRPPVEAAAARSEADADTDAHAHAAAASGEVRRGHRRWPMLAVLAGLIALVTAALAFMLVPSDGRSTSPPPTSSSSSLPTRAPSAVRTTGVGDALPAAVGTLLPGSTVLGRRTGTGSGSVRLGRLSVPAGRQLTLSALCVGQGGAQIGPVTVPTCSGSPTGAAVDAGSVQSLRVDVDPATRWSFAVVAEPDDGTNGALHHPAESALRFPGAAGVLGSGAGRGPAAIRLAAAPRGAVQRHVVHGVRVLLSCSGTGVRFSSADHRFDGNYTSTCFPGWSYEFDVAGAALPNALRLAAAPATSWRVVVVAA